MVWWLHLIMSMRYEIITRFSSSELKERGTSWMRNINERKK